MTKRVFIVHGWDGAPTDPLFVWFKSQLTEKGFEAHALEMPDTAHPRIEPWVSHLAASVGQADEQTYFVAHSIGAQTVLRYLETLPEGAKVGGAAFVAPWLTVQNVEEMDVVNPWLNTPINFEKIKTHTQKFFAVFSDNDTWVPISNKDVFKEKLGVNSEVETQKGHFTEADGVVDCPLVVEKLLEMAA